MSFCHGDVIRSTRKVSKTRAVKLGDRNSDPSPSPPRPNEARRRDGFSNLIIYRIMYLEVRWLPDKFSTFQVLVNVMVESTLPLHKYEFTDYKFTYFFYYIRIMVGERFELFSQTRGTSAAVFHQITTEDTEKKKNKNILERFPWRRVAVLPSQG